MDADKSGPGRRKNPRGNLSKVMVRIIDQRRQDQNIADARILWQKNTANQRQQKNQIGAMKKLEKKEPFFVLPLGKGNIFLAPKINNRKPILKSTIVPPAGKFNKKAKNNSAND